MNPALKTIGGKKKLKKKPLLNLNTVPFFYGKIDQRISEMVIPRIRVRQVSWPKRGLNFSIMAPVTKKKSIMKKKVR